MNRTAEWFRQGLGSRIDALEAALQGLRANAPESVDSARRLARALLGPSQAYGFRRIHDPAAKVEAALPDKLEPCLEELIAALRHEAAQGGTRSSSILIVGGRPDFLETLSNRLHGPRRQVLLSPTAAKATAILREQSVSVVLLHLVLPDLDGRTFLQQLRESPETASLPVLLLCEDASDAVKQDGRSLKADASFDAPLDIEKIVTWVSVRLRRAHETIREARRDSLTGLMNRAAFGEHFNRVIATVGNDQPNALALISIAARAEDEHAVSDPIPDSILQQVASQFTASLRDTDILARWEADQFIALFPGEDPFGGTRAVEKLIELLHDRPFHTPKGRSFTVFVSAGVALVDPHVSLHDVVTEADGYLFQARAAGSNRVVSTQSEAPPRHQRVLLVMRNDVAARVMRHLFEKDGFVITHVDTVDDATNMASGDHIFNLLLIDESPLSGSGFDLLQRARELPRYNRVPVVMLLAENSEESVVRSLELGANDYLIRPFSPFTLMTRMRRLLSRGARLRADDKLLTILLIDDDPGTLMILGSALHRHGAFRVILAKGAETGWQRLLHDQPDATLIAYRLAKISGEQLVERIAGSPDTRGISVILAVDHKDEEDAARLLTRGVKGLLRKPFEPRGLAAETLSLLGMAKQDAAPLPESVAEAFNAEIQRVLHSGS